MMCPRFSRALAGMAALVLAACGSPGTAGPRPEVALFTTLPILWPEETDLRGILASAAPPHWALAALGGQDRVLPVDALVDDDGVPAMAAGRLLVMAQPRPLSPQENVALDDWVNAGGRVLLFADPLLTRDSAFPLGDSRRPQDVVLLSPILGRWGLELQFDEEQEPGEKAVTTPFGALPVNLPGRFAARPGSSCTLDAGGLVARCPVGKGSVIAIADATLFEDGDGTDRAMRAERLATLVEAAAQP